MQGLQRERERESTCCFNTLEQKSDRTHALVPLPPPPPPCLPPSRHSSFSFPTPASLPPTLPPLACSTFLLEHFSLSHCLAAKVYPWLQRPQSTHNDVAYTNPNPCRQAMFVFGPEGVCNEF